MHVTERSEQTFLGRLPLEYLVYVHLVPSQPLLEHNMRIPLELVPIMPSRDSAPKCAAIVIQLLQLNNQIRTWLTKDQTWFWGGNNTGSGLHFHTG